MKAVKIPKILRSSLIAIALLGGSFTAVMGFAHTKAGHPLLAYLGWIVGKPAGCPLGYDRLPSAEQRTAARLRYAEKWIDEPLAATKPALEFVLGKTTRQEFEAWNHARRGLCTKRRGSDELECVGPYFASANVTLWPSFDEKGALVSLRGVESFSDPKLALAFFGGIRSAQARGSLVEKGSPDQVAGSGLLAQASLESHFRNYKVVARLTKHTDGIAVTHEFQSF